MHKKYSEKFIGNLKYIRQDKNLTQNQLAEKLDIPVSTYANWEQGRREPSIDDIYKLLYILEIKANDLIE